MVVVSHLFFFFDKKFGESVTRYESHPPSLELSISRQPLSAAHQEGTAGNSSCKVGNFDAYCAEVCAPLFVIRHKSLCRYMDNQLSAGVSVSLTRS